MSYYFLVASLPSFTLDDPPGLSEDAFMDRCRDQLSPRDWAAMQAVMAPAPRADPHPFAEAWYRVETALRNALVRVRAERRKADAAAYLRENAAYGAEASRAVADAFGARPRWSANGPSTGFGGRRRSSLPDSIRSRRGPCWRTAFG